MSRSPKAIRPEDARRRPASRTHVEVRSVAKQTRYKGLKRDPGAATTKRVHQIRPASLPELAKLTAAMREHLQALILLAAWCALRFGELTELRRRDVDLDADRRIGVIRIERAVVRVEDGFRVTTPKSDAGTRDVAVPPHLVPMIQEHLAAHVGPEPDALVFPAHHGGHLAPSTLWHTSPRISGASSWQPVTASGTRTGSPAPRTR